MPFPLFDDVTDKAKQVLGVLVEAAEAVIEGFAALVGLLILVWLTLYLGPAFLLLVMGAPVWVVMMLLFGV